MDFLQVVSFLIGLFALIYLSNQDAASSKKDKKSDNRAKEPMKTAHSKERSRSPPHLPAPLAVSTAKKTPLLTKESEPINIERKKPLSIHERGKALSKRSHLIMENPSPQKNHHFEIEIKAPSRIRQIVDRLKDKRELMIYHEVIDKPKSLRTPEK